MRACLIALLVLVPTAPSAAQAGSSLAEIFAAANEAAFHGDHDAAARGYERLVEVGVEDPDVFYDLGLAYAHSGQHGRAAAAFERALRARPGDAGAIAGLEASRNALGRRRADQEGEAVVDAGTPFGESLFGSVSEDVLAVGVLALVALFFGLLGSLSVVVGERARLAVGILAPLAGIALSILGFALLARTGAFDPGPAAIVVREDAALREGPSPAATERHRAHEGERAYMLGDEAGFVHVVLAGGREGWVAVADLVPL